MGEDLQNPKYLDLAEFNARLERRPGSGRRVWRSLEELADTEAFRELVHREFPKAASEWDDGHSRRDFLKLMGASLALAGVTDRRRLRKRRDEKIVPYVQQPEQVVPGRPLYFASAMVMNGFGNGVLVEQHEGRPTKIEGNPDHPASQGATNVWMQASVLQLYDPDRSQAVMRAGLTNSWGTFLDQLQDLLQFDLTRNQTGGLERKPRKQPGACGSSRRPSPRRRSRSRSAVCNRSSPGCSGTCTTRSAATTRWPGQSRRSDASWRRSTGSTGRRSSCRSTATSSWTTRAACATPATSPAAAASTGSAGRSIRARWPGSTPSRARPTISGTKADHRLRLPPDEVRGGRAGNCAGPQHRR